ncbi:MAG: hypothetical protein LLG14_27500 [Nocardiaceae bacterium]|nr:hypothetical protein [Nocardiaceae bacterium]
MVTSDVERALYPYDGETHVVVRLKVEGGEFFELAVDRIEYVPAKGNADAYLAIIPCQGA